MNEIQQNSSIRDLETVEIDQVHGGNGNGNGNGNPADPTKTCHPLDWECRFPQ